MASKENYRKGDQHSGGGGSHGGGGKKQRPPTRWEKADYKRGMNTEHSPYTLPHKPRHKPAE